MALPVWSAGPSAVLWACCALLVQLHGGSAQATYPSEFRLSWCMGTQCFDHSVSAAHFQLRINRYYAKGTRPPVREAFFIATLPIVYQRELLLECPGLVVLAHLLLAEVRLYTHPPGEAAELLQRAMAMMAMPEIAGVHMHSLQHSWPLNQALERYESVVERLESPGHAPLSVDFVLPHCHEDLSWLGDRSKLEMLPERTRIFIYEKCGDSEAAAANLTALLGGRVQVIRAVLEDAVDPSTGRAARRDECTAYLTHVARQYTLPMSDVILFLHGDPSDHTPLGLLNIVLRGIALGTLGDVDFLHLGAPRMVSTANPCQAGLFEAAFGRPLKPERPLSTYCCSQFLVSKRRISMRSRSEYLGMLRLVDGSVPDVCERIGPSYERYAGARLSHCFFLEFMWHVVFGEEEELPLRGDDARLPPALRLKDNEESMPSVWGSYLGTYIAGQATFEQQGHIPWLAQIRQHVDIGPRLQVNFGDFAHS